MRLIDADAFKEYLWKCTEANADIIPQRLVDTVLYIMDGIMLDIDEQPTVDAVSVVRCEACKHFKRQTKSVGLCEGGFCNAIVGVAGRDFCCFGERRDDD